MTAAIAERTARRPQPGRRPTTKPQTDRTPKLRVIDQQATRRRARRRNALLGLFLAVLAGFFVVAFVHADLVAGQQQLDTVRAEIVEAELQHAELARLVEQDSAPDVIVARAVELGMVPANEPVFLAAVAPRPEVTVQPPLPEATEPLPPAADHSPDRSVASPDPNGIPPLATVSGTVGVVGGVAAGVRVELGVDDQPGPSDPGSEPVDVPTNVEILASPVGATSDTSISGSTAATTAPVESGATEPVTDAAPSTEPSSSLAGSRAVSTSASGPGGG